MTMSFGDWLKNKRGRRGDPDFVSQDELAQRMGLSRTYVLSLEQLEDPPTYPTRQKIHKALGTTEDELILLGIVRGIVRGRRSRPEPLQAAEPDPLHDANAFPHLFDAGTPHAEIVRIIAAFDNAQAVEVLSFATWVRDRKPVNVPVVLAGR